MLFDITFFPSRIGYVCASYPWLVLSFTSVLLVFLFAGLLFARVTTDPIELWSAPQSRSRAEKDFYDETFEPFYRVEQVKGK